MADRSFRTDLRTVLRNRGFRRLFAVRLSAQVADGALEVGLAGLVFFSPERSATTQAAATAALVTLLPYTVLAPFVGVLLDVWSRRQILLVVNLVRSALAGLMALIVITGSPDLWLFAAALVGLSLNRFLLAGLGACLPSVVAKDELVMANAVSPTVGTVALLTGAALASIPRAVAGSGAGTDALVLAGAGLLYLAAATLALRIPRQDLGPEHPAALDLRTAAAAGRDLADDVAAGAGHVRHRPAAAYALGIVGLHRLGYGVMTIALVLLCRNYFTDPADPDAGLALLTTCLIGSGVGIALAAVLTPIGVRRWGRRGWVTLSLSLSAITHLLLVLTLTPTAAVLGSLGLSLSAQSLKICVDAVVQESVDERFRGRVFAFYDTIFNGALILAAVLAVLVVPSDGNSRALLGGIGVLSIVAALGYRLLAPAGQPSTSKKKPISPPKSIRTPDSSTVGTPDSNGVGG